MSKLPAITPVVCSGCTCLCDDLEPTDAQPSAPFASACEIGKRWLTRATHAEFMHYSAHQPVELESAIKRAKVLLKQSVSPLVCGLEMLSTQAQQSAFRFADHWQACIDTTLSNAGRSSQFSLQRVGKVTATLGEVAQRSDVVVCWFCDPVATHPRHFERYSNPATGPKRQIICIDSYDSATSKQADVFLKVAEADAAAVLANLRGIVLGIELDSTRMPAADAVRELGECLLSAKYGAWFYGSPVNDSVYDLVNDSMTRLMRELNQRTRFVSIPMRKDFNALSAENVLAWSSGYSFALNLNRGFPRSNQLEYSAESMLSRGECDLILLASTRNLKLRLEGMSASAIKHWQTTPKIVLCESGEANPADAVVQFSVQETGKNVSGDFCRQDDVSLPLRVPRADNAGASVEKLLKLLGDCGIGF